MIWKVYGPGGKRQPDRRESIHKRKLVGRNEGMGELFPSFPGAVTDELSGQIQLRRCGLATETDLIQPRHPSGYVAVGRVNPAGQGTGAVQGEWAVHQVERLLRDGRLVALGAGRVGAGEIEGSVQSGHLEAIDKSVKGPFD